MKGHGKSKRMTCRNGPSWPKEDLAGDNNDNAEEGGRWRSFVRGGSVFGTKGVNSVSDEHESAMASMEADLMRGGCG